MINYVGEGVIKALPRLADDGRKSLNRGIMSAAGKPPFVSRMSWPHSRWTVGWSKSHKTRWSSLSCRFTRDRVSKKLFGIQWQPRGEEASESNLNLVFKEMSWHFSSLLGDTEVLPSNQSYSQDMSPVHCGATCADGEKTLTETCGKVTGGENVPDPHRYRLPLTLAIFRVAEVIYSRLAFTNPHTQTRTKKCA